jgi:hypothetical protein
MFEPFHAYKVDICKEFKYRQYLRPENKDKYFLETANLILTGKIKNKWINSQNKRIFSNKRLIKDIRANLMLKWIHTNFPSVPIILLFRHPCAIAYSRIKKIGTSILNFTHPKRPSGRSLKLIHNRN